MNILLVEDEKRVADFIQRGLNSEGWNVTVADDGETGLDLAEHGEFSIVILDLMLPGISGQEVCQRLRARDNWTPILMLTALDKTDEKVAGLRMGADDYLPKPFDFEELIARIDSLVRREKKTGERHGDIHLLSVGALSLDTKSLEVKCGDRQIQLSAKERDLLRLLLSDPNAVYSRERILNTVWGASEDPLTNIVDVYISRLRKKLGEAVTIETIRGAGYKLSTKNT